jgi:hypothetical protein
MNSPSPRLPRVVFLTKDAVNITSAAKHANDDDSVSQGLVVDDMLQELSDGHAAKILIERIVRLISLTDATYFPHITCGISSNFRGCPEPRQVS